MTGLVLALLILWILCAAGGFAFKFLWYAAVILFVLWLIGLFTGRNRV